jgi:hypothetical protein
MAIRNRPPENSAAALNLRSHSLDKLRQIVTIVRPAHEKAAAGGQPAVQAKVEPAALSSSGMWRPAGAQRDEPGAR